MNYINFFRISFCLLLNISILHSSEMENTRENWSNPLMEEEIYLTNGKFTLANAKEAIEGSEKDLINSFSSSPIIIRPLEWLCMSTFKAFSKENRLKLADFLLKNGANKESIEEAYFFLKRAKHDTNSQTANPEILELLNSVIKQKNTTIKTKDLKNAIESALEIAIPDDIIGSVLRPFLDDKEFIQTASKKHGVITDLGVLMDIEDPRDLISEEIANSNLKLIV